MLAYLYIRWLRKLMVCVHMVDYCQRNMAVYATYINTCMYMQYCTHTLEEVLITVGDYIHKW